MQGFHFRPFFSCFFFVRQNKRRQKGVGQSKSVDGEEKVQVWKKAGHLTALPIKGLALVCRPHLPSLAPAPCTCDLGGGQGTSERRDQCGVRLHLRQEADDGEERPLDFVGLRHILQPHHGGEVEASDGAGAGPCCSTCCHTSAPRRGILLKFCLFVFNFSGFVHGVFRQG